VLRIVLAFAPEAASRSTNACRSAREISDKRATQLGQHAKTEDALVGAQCRGLVAASRPGPDAALASALEPGGLVGAVGTWDGEVFSINDITVEPAPLPLPRA
jgi:hypothetical protein